MYTSSAPTREAKIAPPDQNPASRAAGRAAAVIAVIATVAAHARFLTLDARPPRDLCNCQRDLPRLAESLHTSLLDGAWDAARISATPTGWYNVVRALAATLVGRHPETIQAFDLLSVATVVAATAWLAWRWSGPAAGGISALLVAAMPALVVEGRQGWIHIPEAALVLVAVALWSADPVLTRKRTAIGLALAGGLAILLRPSGLLWMGTLLPLFWGTRLRPRLAVLAAWAICAIVPLLAMPEYLHAKAEARDRYATVIPQIFPQFLVLVGPAALLVVVIGLGAAAWTRWRVGPTAHRVAWLGAGWVAVALGLAVVFRAGLDNHTLLLPGLALTAGWGFSRWPRLGLVLAALGFVYQTGPQWAPLPGRDAAWWRMPGAWRIQVAPSVLNYYVPFTQYGTPQVHALIRAVCGPGRCTIIADQGLYLPYGEEPGVFELFAAGEDNIRLEAVRSLSVDKAPRADALVEFECPQHDGDWNIRWPDAPATRAAIIRAQQLEPIWATEVGPGCMVRWLTPRRHVPNPQALPPLR